MSKILSQACDEQDRVSGLYERMIMSKARMRRDLSRGLFEQESVSGSV